MDQGSKRDSCRTSGTRRRVHSTELYGEQLSSRQESDVKEEVECSPESSQQLEPEFLNCATDVSQYKRSDTLLSTNNNGLGIEHGDKYDSLDVREICVNQFAQIMDFDQQNTDAVVFMPKSSTEEGPTVVHGVAEMRGLECCKKTKSVPEPQVQHIVGDEAGSSPESECLKDPAPEIQVDSVKENEEAGESSPFLPQKAENSITELQSKNTGGRGHESASERKEDVAQPCLLKEKVASVEMDEDLYRDEEEIEKEKTQKVAAKSKVSSKDDLKLGVGPEADILEYCRKEWRGKTTVAKKMKEGYEEVSHYYGSIRQIRGDNYCALRATLFQCLSQSMELPRWLDDDNLLQLPENLSKKYEWIKLWRFWNSSGSKKPWIHIRECLSLLKKKWAEISKMKICDDKQKACDEIFQNEGEHSLYEAVKFLMLRTAIDLFNANEEGKEVPVFSWLLFARNTSNNPCEFMKNHLNQVGHSGGLEQVEMFLLGYALQHTIKVYRLYKYGTDEFITQYPDDQSDWPMVTLITEDDRHYNVPVRVCEETCL
ncbi:ubiquitin thioesterase otulin [Hyperolius riggenbachi]|uniref:ubiquitin thioesterase otulin n=1 Tax=Hyperolius riggenbachi TaxID=752182 RepID=UPI0035A39A46